MELVFLFMQHFASKGSSLRTLWLMTKYPLLIDFGLLHTARNIALFWKSMDAPHIRVWMLKMIPTVTLERLIYIKHEEELMSLRKYVNLW